MSATGWIDVVIVLTLVEALALAAYHRLTGRGMAPRDFAPTLAAGMGLMFALRSALADGFGVVAAAWLLAAGAAHVADLWRRWGRRGLAPAR
jgi:hypothetical protein